MKRIVLFLVGIITLCEFTTAQIDIPDRARGKERIAQQVRHYVGLFGLDEVEAHQFDSLYKAYTKEMYAIHLMYKQDDQVDDAPPTDEQIDKRLLNNFAQSRAILDVREHFYREFRKILSPTQINTILEDERARRARAIAGYQQH